MARVINYTKVILDDENNKVNVTFRNLFGDVNKPFPYRCDINNNFKE
jgi:hypothetical protein